MHDRKLVGASVLTAAALATVAVAADRRLPAAMRLPTHWGPDGLPDRFADAGTALAMPVLLTILIALVMAALPRIEPLQPGLDRSATLFRTVWLTLLAFMALIEAVVAAPAFGLELPATTVLAGAGLLIAAIGNVLPKSRPNFVIGIRTPWTIADPDNWIATHRLGGRVMTAAGIAVVALALLPLPADTRAALLIAALAATVVAPVTYSFLLWRRTAAARG